MTDRIFHRTLSFSSLEVRVTQIGSDILITLQGGDRPHIGCAVLSLPRPSLTGDQSGSCTSSVLNVTGHKDETICRYLSEEICRKTGTVCCCTGGFHADHIQVEQIEEVLATVKSLTEEILESGCLL